jgi:hypothetical protein
MGLSQEQKDKLLFRRQFVIGSRFVEQFPLWRKYQIADKYFLTAHPDLSVCSATFQKFKATLIGFMIDWTNENAGDADILSNVLNGINRIEDVFERCNSIGGRWVLVVSDDNRTILFSDTCGLRQVFYTSEKHSERWIASQPNLIAELLGIKQYSAEAEEFISSFYFVNSPEYWWPGESSPYENIKHLLPNYFLEVDTADASRFWPIKAKQVISLDEGIQKAARILKGLLAAANNRFDLALPLTAGQDSRLLLASCKDVIADIYVYTQKYYFMRDNDRDVVVPQRLMNKLGFKHNIINCPSEMDNDFKEIYKRSISTAHDVWGVKVQGLLAEYPQEKICLKGNCNEIARCEYHRYGYPRKHIDAKFIASLTYGLSDNQFAIEYYDKWLRDLGDIEGQYGYRVLDLFYWEHKMGCWQAMQQQEWDIAQEEFTPFNCRELLDVMLGVDEKFRRPPKYVFFMRLIKYIWPEVLVEPINRVNLKGKLILKSKELLGMFNLFHCVQNMYYCLRKGLK